MEADSFTYNSMEACKAGGAVVSGFTDTSHTEEECRHYKAGNLYNWTAATAKSGLGKTSGSASDSICPSGWQLPINGSNAVDKSWSKSTDFYFTLDITTDTQKTYAIQQAPLYLVRSGAYGYERKFNFYTMSYESILAGQVVRMYYWSATAYSGANSYYLSAYPTNFSTQVNYDHGLGLSVRCVVR